MSGLTSDQKFAGGDHVTPEVLWAQRSSSSDPARNFVYLTISAPDVPPSSLKLDLKPTGLTFTGHSDTKKLTYHVSLEFYAEIDPEESKVHHTARDVELVLRKKELNEEFWPRLTKEKQKLHYLKTDFDKWVDEDEQDTLPDDDMMNQFGGGMGGMGGDGGFGGIDFSKLGGGAGGMGGLGGAEGLGGLGGLGGDESDDDLPDLEDENEGEKEGESADAATGETGASATKTAAGGKIEEVS